ncbi:hypothetical protein [Streptosporangium sp. NPDC023615]|uniref:hypothetical protein n=1 Tax=Streptosporangium sp. NPDC023615 TaxID=3154794 RepID=UPI00341E3352
MGYPPQYGKPSQGETGRGLAVILVLALGVAIGAVVTMFMVFDPPASPPASARGADHSEASVRQAVQPALDAYGSGSYDDFWDLWTTGAKKLISREEYVRLFTLCPPIVADSPFTVASVAISGDTAVVRADRGGATTEFGFVFEKGSWSYEPSLEERAEYRKPVDQLAAERRTAGFCGTTPPGTTDPNAPPGTTDPNAPPSPGSTDPNAPPGTTDPNAPPPSGSTDPNAPPGTTDPNAPPSPGSTGPATTAPPLDSGQGAPDNPSGPTQ